MNCPNPKHDRMSSTDISLRDANERTNAQEDEKNGKNSSVASRTRSQQKQWRKESNENALGLFYSAIF